MDCYLSIIATTRNDNHGGDLLRRTSAFVTNVFEQSKKFNVQVELILVEWNPPSDKPLLKDVLPKPGKDIPVSLKYVIVSNEIHNTYKNASTIPLYQMIAKNVGIRRAIGEFILCTNIDILFTDKSFEFFAKKRLETGKYYRANRCDIPKEVMDIDSIQGQLEYAEKNIIQRLGKTKGHEALHLPKFATFSSKLASLLNYSILKLWKATHKGKFPHFTIDFNACGDFTLMSKADWEDIQGYPELDMYSIHIDSMGVWAANAMGKKQVILPKEACIYHIYHEDGWESDDPIKTIKFLANKPSLDYSIVFRGGMMLVEKKKSWDLNDEDWGMNNLELEEYVFNSFEN